MRKGPFVEASGWAVLLALLVLVYHCKNPKIDSEYYSPVSLATHYNGEHYVGSETCMECHADIHADHIKNPHSNTSAIASENTILGSFETGSNVLDLEYVRFTMERKADSFYQQTQFKNRSEKKPPSTFDVVIGSGVRGQSYATWKGDKLFQLQTSYHKATNSWVNSPGFPNYGSNDRPIRDACLKCHITFATNRNPAERGNRYDKGKIMYGIDCERCHRPSAKHVEFHRSNPDVQIPKFAMKFDTLSRQQRLDVCAQCHSGLRENHLNGFPFSFLPGENLNEYSQNVNTKPENNKLDVHGNQYGLLVESECFRRTPNMDCITCHDPHKGQRGNTEFFNNKCTQCHIGESVTCEADHGIRNSMGNNCIACHMPNLPSEVMKVQVSNLDSLETAFNIRTHLIAIYPQEQWERQ